MIRRLFAPFLVAVTIVAGLVTPSTEAAVQVRHRVDLPAGTVLDPGSRPVVTSDGQIGFVAPATGDTVVVFAVRTGETLARVQDLGVASGLSLYEGSDTRLLAVTVPRRVTGETIVPATVVILDVTNIDDIHVRSTLRLADTIETQPSTHAVFSHDGQFGVLAVSGPVPALLSFDPSTGRQVGALVLDGRADEMRVFDGGASKATLVALSSAATDNVAIVELSPDGVLLPVASFRAPDDAPLSEANNVQFSADGQVAYVASLKGSCLMSFRVATGELLDRISTEGSSASISVYRASDRDVLAVTNISRPGSANIGGEDERDSTTFGFPGTVILEAGADGKFVFRSRFSPDTGDVIAPANIAAFDASGSALLVPTRTGAIYTVDVATGRSAARQVVDDRVQSMTLAPLAESVAVVTAGDSGGSIEILPIGSAIAPQQQETPVEKPRAAEPAHGDKPAEKPAAKTAGTSPLIDRLAPPTVQAGRRHDITVVIVGSGFESGAAVMAGGTLFTASVNEKGRRAQFDLPAALLAVPTTIPVQIINPGGTASNVVSLSVVRPYAPVLTKVSPDNLPSGSGGQDLRIHGDHFRDGAVVKVTFNDPSGTQQTVELKTYRLSFTSIVARLPQSMTIRAQVFQLTVTDRDGESVSGVLPVIVAGPAISTIEPSDVTAGSLKADESLKLKITGTNLHSDAVVYVRQPVRGENDTGNFVRVAASNVQWKSTERINITLSAYAVAYSGPLVVRLFNPVPGLRPKQGDVAEMVVPVTGAMVTSTTPDSIIAGSGSFILKLAGSAFRNGAMVKVQRDGGGSATRRVLVEDPNVKDGTRINVPFDTPSLLRLVARPGTIFLRVLNPTLGKADPSPAVMVPVVGPGLTSYQLTPRAGDPQEYRLTLTGEHFGEGATVVVLTSDGVPVGKPVEARVHSDTELVVGLSRARVTNLRTFKVRVVNPGGPYNSDGVPSNDLDVTVQ